MMERFPVRVVGVDPSRRMLAQVPPGALLARASAEQIPLRDATCDLALLSMVIHHIEDLPAACGEVARVLRPRGRALVRNCFRDRLDEICFFGFSPAAKRAENERMPSVATVEALGGRHGLETVALRVVRQETDESLATHYARLQKRAMSTFALLTEDEILAGLAAVAEAVRAEREPAPVVEGIDLLVLEKRWRPLRM